MVLTKEQIMAIGLAACKKAEKEGPSWRKKYGEHPGVSPARAMELLEEIEGSSGDCSDGDSSGGTGPGNVSPGKDGPDEVGSAGNCTGKSWRDDRCSACEREDASQETEVNKASLKMGEEAVSKLTAKGGKVNTSPVRWDTHAVESTGSSKSGLTEDQLRAMSLEARRSAHKAVERLTPEERKAISQMGVPAGRAMEILEEIENADEREGEATEAAEAEAEAAKTKNETTGKGGKEEQDKASRDA